MLSRWTIATGVVWVGACSGMLAFAQGAPSAALQDVQLEWVRSVRPTLGGARPAPAPSMPDAKEQKGAVTQLWAISLHDKTLYRVLRRWAAQAQYQLVWQTDRDFPIESEVVFEGSFRSAVTEVMEGVSQSDYPLQAIFNPSTRVLRVTRFMDEREAAR